MSSLVSAYFPPTHTIPEPRNPVIMVTGTILSVEIVLELPLLVSERSVSPSPGREEGCETT